MHNLVCRLRERVVLQLKSYTKDSYGGYTETWSDYMTCWAAINPILPPTKSANLPDTRAQNPSYSVFFRGTIPVKKGMRIKTHGMGVLTILSYPIMQLGKKILLMTAQMIEDQTP